MVEFPSIGNDDPDSFVSLSEAARATFQRLAELHGLPAGGLSTDPTRRGSAASDQMAGEDGAA